MKPTMNEDQKNLFIEAMQLACSSGSIHRYECLEVYIQAKPEKREAAIDAFAAFERGCGYCPEATEKLHKMTNEEFYFYVTSYCQWQKSKAS